MDELKEHLKQSITHAADVELYPTRQDWQAMKIVSILWHLELTNVTGKKGNEERQ